MNSLGEVTTALRKHAEKIMTLMIKNYGVRKEQIISGEEILMKGHLLEREERTEIRIMILKTQSRVVLLNGKLLTDHKGKQPENSAFQRSSCDFDLRV